MKTLRALTIAGLVLAADQLVKALVRTSLSLGESTPLALGMRLTRVHNTGAGFGLFPDGRWLLVVVSLLVLGWIIWDWKRIEARHEIPIALVMGGLLGNLVDRLFLDHVLDYLHPFSWFPVFNIADISLTVAGVWLALTLMHRR